LLLAVWRAKIQTITISNHTLSSFDPPFHTLLGKFLAAKARCEYGWHERKSRSSYDCHRSDAGGKDCHGCGGLSGRPP
jgi:hypothetical protein